MLLPPPALASDTSNVSGFAFSRLRGPKSAKEDAPKVRLRCCVGGEVDEENDEAMLDSDDDDWERLCCQRMQTHIRQSAIEARHSHGTPSASGIK